MPLIGTVNGYWIRCHTGHCQKAKRGSVIGLCGGLTHSSHHNMGYIHTQRVTQNWLKSFSATLPVELVSQEFMRPSTMGAERDSPDALPPRRLCARHRRRYILNVQSILNTTPRRAGMQGNSGENARHPIGVPLPTRPAARRPRHVLPVPSLSFCHVSLPLCVCGR